ncbi:hypothetical protein FKM82_022495 [Ascaphus truei]
MLATNRDRTAGLRWGYIITDLSPRRLIRSAQFVVVHRRVRIGEGSIVVMEAGIRQQVVRISPLQLRSVSAGLASARGAASAHDADLSRRRQQAGRSSPQGSVG